MNLKNRQQLLALLAGAGVALFAADKLLITPLTHAWKARAAEITKLRRQVAEGHSLVQREESLRHRWDQMRANTLPNNSSLAEQQVLKAFDRWSQESRISILSVSPQWKHDTEDYMTLECRVEAAGNLNAVTRFLYDVEKDPMALKLQSVEVSARDNDGQQLALGLQVSALVLTPRESGAGGGRR
jgi:Tfp pilus assembly protein PilO